MQNKLCLILISPLFLFGLFVLLLNDFVLKAQFHNFLTGKISDFAGLFIFPIFWSAILSKRKFLIYISTAFLFVFWKSHYSQFLIDFWNFLEIFRIERIIDFGDLFALSILPFSYFYQNLSSPHLEKFPLKAPISLNQNLKIGFVCLFSLFAFTATSYETDRSIWTDKKYEFVLSVDNFEKIMKNKKSFYIHKFQKDTDAFPSNQYPNLEVNPFSYNAYFDLEKSYCDSRNIRIYLSFEVQKEKIIVNTEHFSYSCKQPPTDKDRDELTTIFEREFIEKIRQNESR